MKEIKVQVDEELLAELKGLAGKKEWANDRSLSIALEAGIRLLVWEDKINEEKGEEDALVMRRELARISSTLSALTFQNFELIKDNRNYQLREGSLQSRIKNLEQQLKDKKE